MRERYEIMKAMNTLVMALNNEDAYMEWIQTVPDQATDDDLMDVATDNVRQYLAGNVQNNVVK